MVEKFQYLLFKRQSALGVAMAVVMVMVVIVVVVMVMIVIVVVVMVMIVLMCQKKPPISLKKFGSFPT